VLLFKEQPTVHRQGITDLIGSPRDYLKNKAESSYFESEFDLAIPVVKVFQSQDPYSSDKPKD